MKRLILIVFALILSVTSFCYAQQQTAVVTERLTEKPLPSMVKGKLLVSSYYDYGWTKLHSRDVKWGMSTDTIAYAVTDQVTPYITVNAWDRNHILDTTVDFGAYIRFKDSSFIRSEIGFDSDPEYLYKFQTLQEYNHRLYKNLFWLTGYHYLHYAEDDVFIGYPGLVYYFGDNYVSATYNVSTTESRGSAQWGVVKGSFALTDRINLSVGTAVGQRLYDIDLLPASKQYGYIMFMGLDTKITDSLGLRLGYSYSRERPAFIKRSLEFGLSYKF